MKMPSANESAPRMSKHPEQPHPLHILGHPLVLVGSCAALVALAYSPIAIRPLALPIALWFPGHLVLVLLTARSPTEPPYKRLSLVVITSIASYSLLALISFAMVQRLTKRSLVAVMIAFTIFVCIVSAWRRRRKPMKDPFAVVDGSVDHDNAADIGSASGRPKIADPFIHVVASMCTVIAIAIVVVGLQVIPERQPDPYFRISLAGTWSLVDDVVKITDDIDPNVTVQVQNGTTAIQRVSVLAGFTGQQRWPGVSVTLNPGEERTVTVNGPVPKGCNLELKIALAGGETSLAAEPIKLYFDHRDTAEC